MAFTNTKTKPIAPRSGLRAAPPAAAALAAIADAAAQDYEDPEELEEDQEQAESPAEELARLRKENAALVAAANKPLRLKVAEQSKALSVYGLGRFPVTLYKGQWMRLLTMSKDIVAFIKAHDAELASK